MEVAQLQAGQGKATPAAGNDDGPCDVHCQIQKQKDLAKAAHNKAASLHGKAAKVNEKEGNVAAAAKSKADADDAKANAASGKLKAGSKTDQEDKDIVAAKAEATEAKQKEQD